MATLFPTNIKFKSVLAGTDINVVSNVEALSGKREIITGEISRQTISLATVPLSEAEDRQFQVFLHNIKYCGEFNMLLSDKSIYKCIATTSYEDMDIIDATTIGKTQLVVEQDTANGLAVGVGSFIQFDNTQGTNQATPTKKLYQVTNIVTNFTNVGGLDRYTLTFDQPIKTNHTSPAKLYYKNLVGTFRIEDGNVNKAVSVLGSTGEQYVTYRLNITEVL